MQLLSLFASLALSSLPCAVVADGKFLTPGGDAGKTTLYTGEKFDVEWAGTAAYSTLSLGYYSSRNTTVKWLISNSPNYPTSYTWTPRPALDGFSNWEQEQFFLYIVNGTNFGAPFQSPAFTIREKATTTSASTTAGSTAPPATVPAASPTPSGASSETQQNVDASGSASSDAGGLSTGAKAGIGAGVGGCALLIIGLLAFFFLRRRRVEGSHGIYEKPADQDNKADAYLADPRGHEKVLIQQVAKPVEAPSTTQDGGRPTAELGTQSGERFELA